MSHIATRRIPKSVVELFTYDLTTFFAEDNFDVVYSDDTADTIWVDYEKILPWIEFNMFSKVTFRVFTHKHSFEGRSHINVVLPCKTSEVKIETFQNFLNKLYEAFGTDDKHREWLTELEAIEYGKKRIERFWTKGEGKNVYYMELVGGVNFIMFRILFFNNIASGRMIQTL